MIVRSGLIQNRDHIEEVAFGKHWLNVHGPLARQVPNLKAYTQNHILRRFPATAGARLHRIDGISQLLFEDVPTMAAAMDSPEQQACIEDIKGFLSAVTLMIMRPGEILAGASARGGAKLMTVLAGDPTASAEYAAVIGSAAKKAGALRTNHNPVIDRGHVVDPAVPMGEQVAVAMGEFWFESDAALDGAIKDGLLDRGADLLVPLAAFAVIEHRLL